MGHQVSDTPIVIAVKPNDFVPATTCILSVLECSKDKYGKLFGLKDYTAIYWRHEDGIPNQIQNDIFFKSLINRLNAIKKAFDKFYRSIEYLYPHKAIQHDDFLIINVIKDKLKEGKYEA